MRKLPFERQTAYITESRYKAVISELTKVNIQDPFPNFLTPGGNRLQNVKMITPDPVYANITALVEPVILTTSEDPIVVVDVRPYTRWDKVNEKTIIRNSMYMSFETVRCGLMMLEASQPSLVSSIGHLPIRVFINHIMNTLSGRYGLEVEHKTALMIITAYYLYGKLSGNEELLDSKTMVQGRMDIAHIISEVCYTNRTIVLDVMEDVGELTTFEDFVKALREGTQSIRMQTLSVKDFITIMGSTAPGTELRGAFFSALEGELPEMIALTHLMLNVRSFHRYPLSRSAQTSGKGADRQQFIKRTDGLISDYLSR